MLECYWSLPRYIKVKVNIKKIWPVPIPCVDPCIFLGIFIWKRISSRHTYSSLLSASWIVIYSPAYTPTKVFLGINSSPSTNTPVKLHFNKKCQKMLVNSPHPFFSVFWIFTFTSEDLPFCTTYMFEFKTEKKIRFFSILTLFWHSSLQPQYILHSMMG